ncbi:hypothetical protein NQ314_015369 [Rhamnusium bicolor]|uniref:Asparagine synthetase [glutamine-hydrolyzing] n=1 Tax=Rhamnusium bicolor TaxID=1586634 RepID=A0AAV8WZU8_9CUCU|nr:hypothetical protein NQ314_015369 [Rhamnusium bicolor]
MCGIICIVSHIHDTSVDLLNKFHIFKKYISNRGPDYLGIRSHSLETCNLLFAASVLWLQGKSMAEQPFEDDKSVFVYNGDIFGGIPDNLREEDGDTKLLFKMIQNSNNIPIVLSKIQGPYAFIYFDKIELKLYFGRDIFGRRSLLIGKNHDELVLTSVAKRSLEYEFIELPSIGTFCLDLKTNQLYIFPWKYRNKNFESKLFEIKTFLNKEIIIAKELSSEENNKYLTPSIEQLCLLGEIKNLESKKVFEILLNNSDWLSNVIKLKSLLEEAIKNRIATQPKYCKNCIKKRQNCNHSLIGVLFSGGIDCAVLALLADKFIDNARPIDLLNVAFDEVKSYQTPDRLTGLQTLEELRKIRPYREWKFLEINVTQKELDEQRKQHIADLIYPLKTILDDSLGCALWFASRGKQESIISPCRVLLVGMGADELFGGYTRHRAAFKKQSWLGLHNALNEDWQNLSHRNLGRDDRIISDHGRQLRTPYLDENVVEFVQGLNSWEKTYPSNDVPKGIGEKILLRSLAYYIGLKKASTWEKKSFTIWIKNSK